MACPRTRLNETVERSERFYRMDQLLQEKVLVCRDDFPSERTHLLKFPLRSEGNSTRTGSPHEPPMP